MPTQELWHIYTDGACSGNPGPGGWGVVVYRADQTKIPVCEFFGFATDTTNNRMEMTAVRHALDWMQPGEPFVLHTDSRLIIDSFTKWLPGWQRRNWRKGDGKPVLNRDLWEQILIACQGKSLRWNWVRGHSGIAGNERADYLATNAIGTQQNSPIVPFAEVASQTQHQKA